MLQKLNTLKYMEVFMEKNKPEDTTKYGEFISSFDKWTTPEKAKEKAAHLENVTKKKSGKVER